MPKETKSGETKTAGQKLADKLFFAPKNCWKGIDQKTEKEIETFARSYMEMLNRGKTEREFSSAVAKLLAKQGFKTLPNGTSLKNLSPGVKVFEHIRGKAIVCAVIGSNTPGKESIFLART